MNDEELRKFCIEQAVSIISTKQTVNARGICVLPSVSIFEISEALFSYIRTGGQKDIHVNLYYHV